MVAWIYVIILILQAVAVNSLVPAILSVTNVIPGATATFECSLSSLTSTASLDIIKDDATIYHCLNIAFTCSKSSSDNDYSDVTFTDLDTPSAKGTFTVANADQTRDGGEWTCEYGTSLISSTKTFVVSAQSRAKYRVTHVTQGATATFECSYPSLTSPTTLDIYKDNVPLYQCTNIASTCSKSSTDNDYSDVTFTGLGTDSAKGTFTVTNADQTRDGGDWTCKYGTSLLSLSVTFVVSESTSVSGASTTETATSPTISSTRSSTVSSSASTSTATVPSTQESETTTTNRTITNANNANPTTTSARNTTPTTASGRNTHPTTTSAINTTPPTASANTTHRTTSSARNTNPTTTSTRNTNPTNTSARNTTDETNKEWALVYVFSIVPTLITLTVVILVITFVCNRTRQIKQSIPPSGMETYSASRHGTHMNPAFEPSSSYSMSMEHSNPVYVTRAHMLNENIGSSGTHMIHDQIFFDDTCTTKDVLEGIEGIHCSTRYVRNWSDLNDSSVNLF